MSCAARRLRIGCALPFGCAMAALTSTPAAASDLRLFTPDTLELSGDVRLVAIDGEKGWLTGGFGKLRSGGYGHLQLQPQLGNASLVWQPQFTWSLGATVVGAVQGGERTQAGLSEAYLTFRPMRSTSGTSFSARAGLMWPPVSLEHEGADWHVADSISPSAINSWIGEEVRPVAIEGTLATTTGEQRIRITAASFAANDTSGTLLTFRGWAIHDRTTLAFNGWPLPPLDDDVSGWQGPVTHPLLNLHQDFAHRPGYYVKLAWLPPIAIRIELFRYDNRANPDVMNHENEWGWRTKFNNLGLVGDLGSNVTVKAQAVQGTTVMGELEPVGKRWVEGRFRSAFLLLTKSFGTFGATARVEAFGTRNRGSDINDEYDDAGWSAMIAGKHDWRYFTGLIELLHVSSTREDREDLGLDPRQNQTQLQAAVRIHW